MPRDTIGRRYPKGGAGGLYLSAWMNIDDLKVLDDLGRYWGMSRSQTLKRAVVEANETAHKFRTEPKVDPKLKGKHVRKRGS